MEESQKWSQDLKNSRKFEICCFHTLPYNNKNTAKGPEKIGAMQIKNSATRNFR